MTKPIHAQLSIKKLSFEPLFDSKHLQLIASSFAPCGSEPPSHSLFIDIGNGDKLACEVSTPSKYTKTVVLIHGLGGSHKSRYMIRMARKLYLKNNKVVRINLRGCGTGKGLSKLPYNAGNSHDILKVLLALKEEDPATDIVVVGFSLGGSLALKLAGELGLEADKLVKTFIGVCPPLDLEHTATTLLQKKNYFYHKYYLKQIYRQAMPWINQKYRSLFHYDDHVTSALWGFENAKDYYQNCSSKHFLSKICVPTHILSAEDDPFTSLDVLHDVSLPSHVTLWATKYGSHMGFLGRNKFQWGDALLLEWIDGNFSRL